MVWKTCQHCHKNRTVQVEVKPGVWVTQTCPACHGAGGVETGTI